MPNTDTPSLFRLSGIVTLDAGTRSYAGREVEYVDYSATVTRAGRAYPVATVTAYPDGHVLITRYHTLNATSGKAWRAMHERLGFPVEPHRAPVSYCTRPTL